MYTLISEVSFDSAHFLAQYEGKCRNIHGHRWTIKVEICGEDLQESGSCIDREKAFELNGVVDPLVKIREER